MVMAACLCMVRDGVVDRFAGRGRARRGDDRPRGGGREALLAIFGHEEEAGMFLWSLGPGVAADGWRVEKTRRGGLASILCGPCGGIGGVTLDPLPEMLEDGTVALVEVGRERFLARLLGRPSAAVPWARKGA